MGLPEILCLVVVIITASADQYPADCPSTTRKSLVVQYEKSPTIIGEATLCTYEGSSYNSESVVVDPADGCSPETDYDFQEFMERYSHCDRLVHCVCGDHFKCRPLSKKGAGSKALLQYRCMESHTDEAEDFGSMLMRLGSELP